jgi:hypothetical protein
MGLTKVLHGTQAENVSRIGGALGYTTWYEPRALPFMRFPQTNLRKLSGMCVEDDQVKEGLLPHIIRKELAEGKNKVKK